MIVRPSTSTATIKKMGSNGEERKNYHAMRKLGSDAPSYANSAVYTEVFIE